jgi:hypothetical protein
MMKKLLIAVVLSAGMLRASADEGMWLPMLLGQQVYNDMVKKGLKLTREQLYSINKSSLKDAIIIFGGGCTGEIVSSQGLIFTNHHCGYDAIATASSVEHNYLRDGFYAMSKDEEISTTLTVQFLDRIVDVTAEVEAGVKGLAWADRILVSAVVLGELLAGFAAGTREARNREGAEQSAALAVILGEACFARVEGARHVAKHSEPVDQRLGRDDAVTIDDGNTAAGEIDQRMGFAVGVHAGIGVEYIVGQVFPGQQQHRRQQKQQ